MLAMFRVLNHGARQRLISGGSRTRLLALHRTQPTHYPRQAPCCQVGSRHAPHAASASNAPETHRCRAERSIPCNRGPGALPYWRDGLRRLRGRVSITISPDESSLRIQTPAYSSPLGRLLLATGTFPSPASEAAGYTPTVQAARTVFLFMRDGEAGLSISQFFVSFATAAVSRRQNN